MTRAEHAARLAASATSSDERRHYADAFQRAQFAEASARGAKWIADTQDLCPFGEPLDQRTRLCACFRCRDCEHRLNLYRLAGYYR